MVSPASTTGEKLHPDFCKGPCFSICADHLPEFPAVDREIGATGEYGTELGGNYPARRAGRGNAFRHSMQRLESQPGPAQDRERFGHPGIVKARVKPELRSSLKQTQWTGW